MRIVVWGINYAPEQIGIAGCNVALCEYLVEQGCDVTMLTAFPYYPEWRKRVGDAKRIFGSEKNNGVRVSVLLALCSAPDQYAKTDSA